MCPSLLHYDHSVWKKQRKGRKISACGFRGFESIVVGKVWQNRSVHTETGCVIEAVLAMIDKEDERTKQGPRAEL